MLVCCCNNLVTVFAQVKSSAQYLSFEFKDFTQTKLEPHTVPQESTRQKLSFEWSHFRISYHTLTQELETPCSA